MVYGLGQRLQEQRLLKNLSQKEVAKSIGISSSIVSNYESGERTPSVEVLIALARLYHCSTDYLLGFDRIDKDRLLDVSMLSEEQRTLLQHFLSSIQA